MAPIDTNLMKDRATGYLAGFSLGQKAVVIIAVITLIAGGGFFASWAAKPTLVPLYSNLNSEDASAITTELVAAGVSYELGNGGGTILVPQSELYQARLDLAGKGLPSGGSQGYKLLDKQGITTSDFRQRIDYQRALEGEISRTISSINGVQAATVHLVIPKDDVFSNDAKKPTASVLVKTAPGKALGGTQVQSIVNLTASAVEGLDPADVTVADGQGRLLSNNNGAGGSNSETQTAQTNSVQDDLTRKVQALLTPLVGEGKAVVQARAELNFDKSTETSEVFNPENKPATPSSQRKTTETMINGVVTDGSCLTNGTIPPGCIVQNPGAELGANGQNYVKTDEAQDNHTDRLVTQTEKSVGDIERVTVAVLLDSNVPNIDAARIEALVTQAAGLQVARGDAVTVERMPFDQTQANAAADELKAAEEARKSEAMMGYIKSGVTLLIILAVLALLFITTKKRAAAYQPQPLSLAELEAAMPALPRAEDLLAELDSQRPGELDTPEAKERAKVDQEISDLIERQPDEVAGLLRSWLADRRS